MRSTLAIVLAMSALCEVGAQSLEVSASDTTAAALEINAEDLDEPEPAPIDGRRTRVTWTTSTRYAFERRAGYEATDSTAFAGPPVSFRSRMRAKLGRQVDVLAVTDHDAGEGFDSTSRIFDFTAAAVTASDVGPIRRAVAGAIRPRFGLGLFMWSGQRMARLASSPSTFLRPSASIRATGSAFEAVSMQGFGVDLRLASKVRVVGFAAQTKADANVDDETGKVSSRPTTGLHRNDREIDSDDRLAGSLAGGAVVLDSRQITAGIAVAFASTDLPIAAGDRPFQRHRFTGDRWQGGSVFASGSFRQRLRFATEIAFDHDGSRAGLLVARIRAGRGLDVFGAWRNYPPTFSSVHGVPPGAAGSGIGNEEGWSVGLAATLARHRITVYRDVYRRPWLQSDSYRPSVYSSWGFHANGRLGNIRFLVRHDSRVANREIRFDTPASAPFNYRERLRVRVELWDDRPLRPSLDLALVRVRDGDTETGYGVGQRLVWRPGEAVVLTSGVVFFDSDSGNSGIYLYEPDLPDYLSVPLLSSAGQRAYIILNRALSRSVTIWIKGALTRFEDERTMGTGVDRITASQLRSVSFAVRLRI